MMAGFIVKDELRSASQPGQFRVETARLHTWLMLALTFSTGVVDAVGFLGLDRVFIGSMTGNVVILGMALSGTTDLPVVGPAIALVMFFLGAMLCGRMLRKRADGWVIPTSVSLIVVSAIMLATSAVVLIIGRFAFPFMTEVIISVLGLAMGIQASAARHVKVADVTTVVVTSTITGLAADSRLGAAKQQAWLKRLSAILLILSGALLGAGLLTIALWLPIAVSAAVTITVLIFGHMRMRRGQGLEQSGS